MKNELASAYATQITGDKRSDYVVYSEDKNILTSLPARLTEQEVFSILNFARKHERIAFNNGINFQKKQSPITEKHLQTIVGNLKSENKRILSENEKLGDTLDRLTRKELNV